MNAFKFDDNQIEMLEFIWDIILAISEYGCYISCALSLLMACKLLRMAKWNMDNLNFINMMLFFYYTLDSIIGTIEIFFLFKLYRER